MAQQVLAAVPSATPTEKMALMEAGLVESNMTNLSGGDKDSAGVFQERPSQGWSNVTNVTAATQQLYNAMNKNLTDPGAMAQSAERSAFPDRYDQEASQAQQLLSAAGGGGISTVGLTQSFDDLTQSLDPTTGLTDWVQSVAVRVGLMVFGAILMLVGVWMAFGHKVSEIPTAVAGGKSSANGKPNNPSG